MAILRASKVVKEFPPPTKRQPAWKLSQESSTGQLVVHGTVGFDTCVMHAPVTL